MNLLQMDMNLLKVLYVLLETSSTGKTAQKLALSPSAVSHALMRLRDALNDPLFRREGNRQIATPYRRYSPEIKNVLPINARARIRRAL